MISMIYFKISFYIYVYIWVTNILQYWHYYYYGLLLSTRPYGFKVRFFISMVWYKTSLNRSLRLEITNRLSMWSLETIDELSMWQNKDKILTDWVRGRYYLMRFSKTKNKPLDNHLVFKNYTCFLQIFLPWISSC